ncbi:heme NO-binding domain-containing protein [Rufibacter sediminis]|uniref:Heme NO-binding domain-containing protein n=1 Tax=Rufibacter sediminis TaxID=2762756 RepID=A0ABR6VWS7_9BACT|nr:heme NO-binding domain-containing protein [Rufibacter sediminis]MBC3541410.1 heme NO-binding domain-containing protein [Rufibacter sediminis]
MEAETTTQDKMHGSMFVLLEHFVESTGGAGAWTRLLEKIGIDHAPYQMQEMYSTDELFALVGQAAEDAGISPYDFMEQYGEFLVPDLLMGYRRYIRPEWRTYEMLLHTEEAMHGAVKKEDPRTSPPKLVVTRQSNQRLIIEYYSKRRMAGVAVGIIRGIAKYYREEDRVKVTRMTEPHAETVQILVDFKS